MVSETIHVLGLHSIELTSCFSQPRLIARSPNVRYGTLAHLQIRLWDVESLAALGVMRGHSGSVKSLCAHPFNAGTSLSPLDVVVCKLRYV